MTTPNTQELDEILDKYAKAYYEAKYESSLNTCDWAMAEAKQSLLDWHNKQVEEAMAKFHLKKGVKYDVKASDSVIVITHTNKLKDRDDDQL